MTSRPAIRSATTSSPTTSTSEARSIALTSVDRELHDTRIETRRASRLRGLDSAASQCTPQVDPAQTLDGGAAIGRCEPTLAVGPAMESASNPSTSHGYLTDRLLRTHDAAQHLDVAPVTLVRWRRLGIGPIFLRIGPRRIFYRLEDLESFVGESAVSAR
ncbi:MAG: helix-turn-helix transcriptional regulator [Polyangiales bacterium]